MWEIQLAPPTFPMSSGSKNHGAGRVANLFGLTFLQQFIPTKTATRLCRVSFRVPCFECFQSIFSYVYTLKLKLTTEHEIFRFFQ